MDAHWVADGLAQFLRSPMWTTPISNFVDDNCIFFDGDEEMKLEYTPIHKQFQELVDTLLTGYIGELGVSAEDALEVIKASEDETHQRLVEYLTYLDDFTSFKKLMEKRNVELEVEAMKELNLQLKKEEEAKAATCTAEGKIEKDEEFDLALQESRTLAELIMKEAEMEDLELQRALALSLAMEQERLLREEEARKAAAAAPAPAAPETSSPAPAAKKEEESKPIEVIQQETMEARVKNLEEANKKIAELGVSPVTVAKKDTEPAPAPAKSPSVDAPAVVRLTNDAPAPAPAFSGGLAPLGRKPIGEGFKVLPPISFKQLQDSTSAPAPVPAAPERKGPTQEEIRRRTEELRKQRDLIIAMKKKERNSELEAATGKAALPATESRDEELARQKQMAVEIARRFRDDLIGESRK